MRTNSDEGILVTGGAGFIGSHLVERLLRDGHSVTVIDDCSTGRWENLEKIKGCPGLSIIESRVSDCPDLPVLCARASFVFHLAAAVGVELVVHSPTRTIETNLEETEVVLKSAAASKTPTLITSTSEVYGRSTKPDFSEEDDLVIGPPTLGRWSYACSKLMDEFLALGYYQERGLPVIITRLFNTVGPRQVGHYGMVLPRFVEAALEGKPLQVYGTGGQTRCFCNVRDTVEALVRLMVKPSAAGQIFNVGSTEEISITALAERVVEIAASRSSIEYIPYNTAYKPGFEDMLRRKPSVKKLEAVTGFRPATPLDRTIRELIESITVSRRPGLRS